MAKKKSKTPKKRSRHERRFLPRSGYSKSLVRGTGALGAALLGAGAWGHLYGHLSVDDQPSQIVVGLGAAGFVFTGIAVWLGTSSEPAVRVGDGGIGLERGELRRMPWHSVESIRWDEGSLSLVARGNDESGSELVVRVPLKTQPNAAAWLARQAVDRIPDKVEIDEEVLERLPEANEGAGTELVLDPIQVVGRKCAESGKTITYEPDARVCTRCERVYHKSHVPDSCACGGSMHTTAALKSKKKRTRKPESSEESAATA